jgi:hypothetical protein
VGVFCPSHASASAPGHQIAVDRAELFCGDQVYDPDFDQAVFLTQSSSLLPSTVASSSPTPRERRCVEEFALVSSTDAAKVACLACDLDKIYSAAFSGERTPYSLAKFLYRPHRGLGSGLQSVSGRASRSAGVEETIPIVNGRLGAKKTIIIRFWRSPPFRY